MAESVPSTDLGSAEFQQPPVEVAISEHDDAPKDQSAPSAELDQAILDAGRSRAFELANMFAAQAAHNGAASTGEGNKRSRCHDSDGETDAPDYKRQITPVVPGLDLAAAAAVVGSLFGDGSGNVTETLMCPPDKVGRVIGRAGATIRDLEATTGTRVQVDHKAPGDKPVTISGKRDEVERAKRTVVDLISGSGEVAPATGEVQKTLECPQGIVGRVIGRGGETIRSLQQASGAHILVNQDFPDGVPRVITITGSQDAVDRATQMVTELISGDHANTQAVIQRYGVGSTEVLECPKSMVGRIIGKGGETIKDLQKRFSVSIQIDQAAQPCKVTITGPTHSIGAARRAVDDLIRPSSAQGPPPGQRPGPGYHSPYPQPYPGGPGAPPYGGYGSFGMQPPSFGPPGGYAPYGYGGYPAPAPAPYAGYNSYGAPAADPYAAAGGYGHNYPSAASSQPQQQQPSSTQHATSTPSVWQALQDDQGRTYYYNSQTGVSQWEKPAEMP